MFDGLVRRDVECDARIVRESFDAHDDHFSRTFVAMSTAVSSDEGLDLPVRLTSLGFHCAEPSAENTPIDHVCT